MNMLNIQKNILKYLKPKRKDAAYLITWRPKEKLNNFVNHKEPYTLSFKQAYKQALKTSIHAR